MNTGIGLRSLTAIAKTGEVGGLCAALALALAVAAPGPARGSDAVATLETPTIQISVHEPGHGVLTTVPVGTSVHARVLVYGSSKTLVPTGQVMVTMFSQGACVGNLTSRFETLINGAADVSNLPYIPPAVGTFCIHVQYQGDANFAPLLTTKTVTIVKGVPTLASAIHVGTNHTGAVTSVAIGTSVHVGLAIGGGGVPPTGVVRVYRYSDGVCYIGNQIGFYEYVVPADGRLDPTHEQTMDVLGIRSFRVLTSGDANYHSVDGPCLPLTVTKATPVVTQAIHKSDHQVVTSIFIGSIVHDSARVTGAAGTPTGKVTILYYSNPACDTPATKSSLATDLVGGAVDVVGFPVAPPVGTVTFQVNYSGDATYISRSSGCLALQVNRFTPNISTQVHNASHAVVSEVSVGSFVHPRMAVTGPDFRISGTATVNVYPSANCTGTPEPHDATLVDGIIDGPFAISFNTPLVRSFRWTYHGSSIYAPGTGSCDVISWKANLTSLFALLHDGDHTTLTTFDTGEAIHAQVSAGAPFGPPTGLVTGRIYANSTCTGSPVLSASGPAADKMDPAYSWAAGLPGQYSHKTVYQGDVNYFPDESACRAFTVVTIKSSTTAKFTDVAGHAITTITLGEGAFVVGIVTGAASPPEGRVDFSLYRNASCTGTVFASSGSFLVDGRTGSFWFIADAAGTISMRARYAGSPTYDASSSGCVTLQVTRLSPSVSTLVHDAEHDSVTGVVAGGFVHPFVAVGGAVGSGVGLVTVSFYENATCAGTPAAIQNASLTAGSVDVTGLAQSLGIGSYAFRASFPGDSNYLPRVGPCSPVLGISPGDTPPPATPPPSPTATAGIPTLPPGASLVPIATPGQETSVPASADPLDTSAPGQSTGALASPASAPGPTGSAAAAAPSTGASSSPVPAAADGSALGLPIVAIAIGLLLVAGLGLGLAARRRRSARQKPA